MGPDDTLRAVKLIDPKQVIPIHYDTFDVFKQDPQAWAILVEKETPAKVKVMKPGDTLDMNVKRKEEIQQEIRRRAFRRFDRLREEKAKMQNTKHTLDALQDVTGLPRIELETIAEEVRCSFEAYEEKFFSIKNQAAIVFGSFGILILLVWLVIIWIF
jgi:hypothetical protein